MEVFNTKVALSENQLKAFCLKNTLPYQIKNLSDAIENIHQVKRCCFIFTGSAQDKYNNGLINHWLFVYGDYIFDSYGFQDKFNMQNMFRPVITSPSQLQEFDADVCGEYCLAFNSFVNNHKYLDFENLGEDFVTYYGFSRNKNSNDNTVLKWYNENK
jgi:hypothetical protein